MESREFSMRLAITIAISSYGAMLVVTNRGVVMVMERTTHTEAGMSQM